MTDEFDFDFDDGGEAGDSSPSNPDFDAQVKDKIKELTAKDPVTRRQAAYWLGESGEPKAITALVQAYKQNKDKPLQDAAKYALGMFRALENALNGSSEQRDRAMILIERIVTEGKMGRRAGIRPGALVRLELVLVVTLIVLVALNIVAPSLKSRPQTDGIATPTQVAVAGTLAPTPDPLLALSDLRTLLGQIRGDGLKLQSQLGGVQAGRKLDCATVFTNPVSYNLPPETAAAFPEVAALVGQINSARIDLVTVKAIFDQGCQPDVKLTSQDVVQPIDTITTMLRNLGGLDAQIDAAQANVQTALTLTPRFTLEPTVEVTVESTPEPTLEPTATLASSVVTTHLIALQSIITQTTDLFGANSQLDQYWKDAQQLGSTEGCRAPVPAIPEDYTAIDATTAQAMPKLKQAADLVNLGLAQVRQSWSLFASACSSNTVAGQAAVGQAFTQAAANAFTAAKTLLDEISLSLR